MSSSCVPISAALPPRPLTVPTSTSPAMSGLLTISPSYKRHPQSIGLISSFGESPSSSSVGGTGSRTKNAHLSSARRANVHDTPSPVSSSPAYLPQASPARPAASPSHKRRSVTDASSFTPSPFSHASSSVPQQSAFHAASSMLASFTPPHCYLFEEGWFVLTNHRLMTSRGPGDSTGSEAGPSSSVLPARRVQLGPMSRNVLCTLHRNQHVSDSCLIWHPELSKLTGDSGWQAVARIPLLQSAPLNPLGLGADPLFATGDTRTVTATNAEGATGDACADAAALVPASPIVLHALLMDELLDQEEAYLRDLQLLLSHARIKPSAGEPVFRVILRRLVPLLTKLLRVHTTFHAAVQTYTRNLYAQIASLHAGGEVVALPSLQSDAALLFSPLLSFLPLEVPRSSHVRIDLDDVEIDVSDSADSPPISSPAASARRRSSNASTSSYDYYQYAAMIAHVLRDERVFPAAAHLRTGDAAASIQIDASALTPNTSSAAAAAKSKQAESQQLASLAASIAPATTSGAGGSTVPSILQHALTGMLAAFDTSMRARTQRLREELDANGGDSTAISSTSGGGGGVGAAHVITPSSGSSSRTDSPTTALRSAGAAINTNTATSTAPSDSVPAASNFSVGPSLARSLAGVRHKRASASSLGQISEGEITPPGALSTARSPATSSADRSRADSRADETTTGSGSAAAATSDEAPPLGVLSVAEQGALLRPLYQVAFYALILKELLALHATAAANGQVVSSDSAVASGGGGGGTTSSPEFETLWSSFRACTFLLAHTVAEEARRYTRLQVLAVERMVFSAPLDEMLVRGRLADEAAPRRALHRCGDAAVVLPSPGAGGGTHLVAMQCFLFSDLLVCGKRLATHASTNNASSPTPADEDPHAGTCTYQQAWPVDAALTVRSISTAANGPAAGLHALELTSNSGVNGAGGRRPLVLHFRAARERSAWLHALRACIAAQRDLAAGAETLSPFPMPPPAMPAALQALCTLGCRDPAAAIADAGIARCYSCAAFLLPAYRSVVWCVSCGRMVCESCGVGAASLSPTSSTSSVSGDAVPRTLDRPPSVEEDLCASTDASNVPHCLRCATPRRAWPDLISPAGVESSFAAPAVVAVGSRASDHHNRPDKLRRISNNRDSNGREVVTSPFGSAAHAASVSSRRASHSQQSSGYPSPAALNLALLSGSSTSSGSTPGGSSPMRQEGFKPHQATGGGSSRASGAHASAVGIGIGVSGGSNGGSQFVLSPTNSHGDSTTGSAVGSPLGSTPQQAALSPSASALSLQLHERGAVSPEPDPAGDAPPNFPASPRTPQRSHSTHNSTSGIAFTHTRSPSSSEPGRGAGRGAHDRDPHGTPFSPISPNHSHHSSVSSVSSSGSGHVRRMSSSGDHAGVPRGYLDLTWTASVPRARNVEAQGKSGRYTTYDIVLTATPDATTVSEDAPLVLEATKRYSEFQSFDASLRRARKRAGPQAGHSRLPHMPSAVKFERFSSHVLEERRRGFEAYLAALLSSSNPEDAPLRHAAINFVFTKTAANVATPTSAPQTPQSTPLSAIANLFHRMPHS